MDLLRSDGNTKQVSYCAQIQDHGVRYNGSQQVAQIGKEKASNKTTGIGT